MKVVLDLTKLVEEGKLTPAEADRLRALAAHVDEDWNMDFWGRDEQAMQRRAFRWAEMQAAATVRRLGPA